MICFPGAFVTLQWTFLFLLLVDVADTTKCLKRDEIEERDGNVYYCRDPALPACCEVDTSFKCCEEPWKTSIRNQMWVVLVILVSVLLLLFVCSLLRGQTQLFKHSTAKQACCNLKEKIHRRFSRKSPRMKQFDAAGSEVPIATKH